MTWNSTSLPVPKGSSVRRVKAAILAQKKLVNGLAYREAGKKACIPSPHDLWREEIRDFLQAEQRSANGCTEGNGHTCGASGAQDPASLGYAAGQHAYMQRNRANIPSLFSYLLCTRLTMLPMQLAIWTKGPSLPSDRPEATDKAKPTDLVNSVRPPR